MKLSEAASEFFSKQRLDGQMLDLPQITEAAIAAARFYAGYGHINVLSEPMQLDAVASPVSDDWVGEIDPSMTLPPNRGFIPEPTAQPLQPQNIESITQNTDVTASDWAVIRPLFLLYVEREQSLLLEASRVMGVDVYGRSTSEIQQEITSIENELPLKAFVQPVISI